MTRSRKNSGGQYPWEAKTTTGNRPRFATIDSESSGEYDMYIIEDAEGKFTEVLSSKEINIRNESPVRFSMHPKKSDEDQNLMETSKRLENNGLKLSANLKPIEKIIEQTDDDKIAEIIQVVEDLKDFYHKSFNGKSGSEGSPPRGIKAEEGSRIVFGQEKGLKFSLEAQNTNVENTCVPTLSIDYHELGELFTKLKAK